MKFRNKKRTEWWICKLVEGKWEVWDQELKTEAAANKKLKNEYRNEDHFVVVRIDMTMTKRGEKKYQGGFW